MRIGVVAWYGNDYIVDSCAALLVSNLAEGAKVLAVELSGREFLCFAEVVDLEVAKTRRQSGTKFPWLEYEKQLVYIP